MLQRGVPLTLLLDLIAPPDSESLYRLEGGGRRGNDYEVDAEA
jgi:hypothetical protein